MDSEPTTPEIYTIVSPALGTIYGLGADNKIYVYNPDFKNWTEL